MGTGLHDMIADPHDGMADTTTLRLSGTRGKEIMLNLTEQKYANEIDKCKALFKFFSVRLFVDNVAISRI